MCLLQFSLRSRCSPKYLALSAWGILTPFKITGGHAFLRVVKVTCTDFAPLILILHFFSHIWNRLFCKRWDASTWSLWAVRCSKSGDPKNARILQVSYSRLLRVAIAFCSRVPKWEEKAIHNSLASCYAAHRAGFIDANLYLLQNSTRIHSHERITKTHLITIACVRKFARYAISCYTADIYPLDTAREKRVLKNVPIILELLIQKIVDNLAARDMIMDARYSRSC